MSVARTDAADRFVSAKRDMNSQLNSFNPGARRQNEMADEAAKKSIRMGRSLGRQMRRAVRRGDMATLSGVIQNMSALGFNPSAATTQGGILGQEEMDGMLGNSGPGIKSWQGKQIGNPNQANDNWLAGRQKSTLSGAFGTGAQMKAQGLMEQGGGQQPSMQPMGQPQQSNPSAPSYLDKNLFGGEQNMSPTSMRPEQSTPDILNQAQSAQVDPLQSNRNNIAKQNFVQSVRSRASGLGGSGEDLTEDQIANMESRAKSLGFSNEEVLKLRDEAYGSLYDGRDKRDYESENPMFGASLPDSVPTNVKSLDGTLSKSGGRYKYGASDQSFGISDQLQKDSESIPMFVLQSQRQSLLDDAELDLYSAKAQKNNADNVGKKDIDYSRVDKEAVIRFHQKAGNSREAAENLYNMGSIPSQFIVYKGDRAKIAPYENKMTENQFIEAGYTKEQAKRMIAAANNNGKPNKK